jgi:hypothetical protein
VDPTRAPIRAIGELPFRPRDVFELLNLSEHRDAPDRDYAGYGHARVDEVYLETHAGVARRVRDALLIAVHSADEPEELDDDIELEFVVPEVGDDYSVTVLLSRFLPAWLPRVSADERAVVLVVCNPHQATLATPAALAASGTPFYYPLGDVESWLETADGRRELRLVADAWRVAGEEQA